MGGRNPYLTKKIQPGEISLQRWEASKILHDAEIIVAHALKAGWLRYPPGTIVGKDGAPVPVVATHNEGKQRPISNYPCLRAYLLRQQGKTMSQISKLLKCSTRKLPLILQHGEVIYQKQVGTSLGGSQTPSKHR